MGANIKAETSIHKLDDAISPMHCGINDGASDDRADKCSISNRCCLNGRRRMVPYSQTATNSEHCKYSMMYMHTYILTYIHVHTYLCAYVKMGM